MVDKSGCDYMSVLDPLTIDGCGISSPPIRAFKKFRAIIKIWARLFVVSMLIRYYQINQSINFSHLQHQMPDF